MKSFKTPSRCSFLLHASIDGGQIHKRYFCNSDQIRTAIKLFQHVPEFKFSAHILHRGTYIVYDSNNQPACPEGKEAYLQYEAANLGTVIV